MTTVTCVLCRNTFASDEHPPAACCNACKRAALDVNEEPSITVEEYTTPQTMMSLMSAGLGSILVMRAQNGWIVFAPGGQQWVGRTIDDVAELVVTGAKAIIAKEESNKRRGNHGH